MTHPERLAAGLSMVDDDDPFYDEDFDDRCPYCKGTGTVNPLTAPEGFFCVGVTDCPKCDGTGEMP